MGCRACRMVCGCHLFWLRRCYKVCDLAWRFGLVEEDCLFRVVVFICACLKCQGGSRGRRWRDVIGIERRLRGTYGCWLVMLDEGMKQGDRKGSPLPYTDLHIGTRYRSR